MSLSFKITFNNRTRRFNIQHGEQINYNSLLEHARRLFQSELNVNDEIEFHYVDDERDIITLSSDIELQSALHTMKPIIDAGKPLRLMFTTSSKSKDHPTNNPTIHRYVSCNPVSNDYKLRNGYEKKQVQPIQMIRIVEPMGWNGPNQHDNTDKAVGYGLLHHPHHELLSRWSGMRGGHPWRRRHGVMNPQDVPVENTATATASSNDSSNPSEHEQPPHITTTTTTTRRRRRQHDEEVDENILESVIEESLEHAMKFVNQVLGTVLNERDVSDESKEGHEDDNPTLNDKGKVDESKSTTSSSSSSSSSTSFVVEDVDEEGKQSSSSTKPTIDTEKKMEESPHPHMTSPSSQEGGKDTTHKKWLHEIELLEDMGFVLDDVDILPLLQKYLGSYEKLRQELKHNDSDESKDRLKKAKSLGMQRLIATLLSNL